MSTALASRRSPPGPRLSAGMVRCAQRELQRLERARERLEQRRSALSAQLAQSEAELAAHHRRVEVLRELAGEPSGQPPKRGAPAHTALGGTALRRAAGALLYQHCGERQIHYREWFERTLAAGYAVSGKDPLASFLTNVRGGPAVIRGSKPGYYRLGPGALERERERHDDLTQRAGRLEQVIAASYQARPSSRTVAVQRTRHAALKRVRRRSARTVAELEATFATPNT